jgi:hypothetical protein
MPDQLIQSIKDNVDELRRYVDTGEYTGFPDYYHMRFLTIQVREDLGKLRQAINSEIDAKMKEAVRLVLEGLLPDPECTSEQILELSRVER